MSIQANQGGGVTIFSAGGTGGGGGGTPGGSSGQLQYNASGSFGGMSGTAWNDTTRSLALTGATVTTSSPVFDLTQTWNAGATTFTAIKMNVTDTASASGSLLLDLQVGGSSQFSIAKDGATQWKASGSTEVYAKARAGAAISLYNSSNVAFFDAQLGGVSVRNVAYIGFSSGSDASLAGADTLLTRSAAASLRLGAADAAAPVAQTLGVQSVVAGTSNTAGTNFTIRGSAGTGTGAGGSLIFQVAPAGGSGTAQNAFSTALTITSARRAEFATTTNTTPTIGFSGDSTSGFASANAFDIFYTRAGSPVAFFGFNRIDIGTGSFTWSSSVGGTADVLLTRDAANTLALRNGTSAQQFNIYKTYTDGSNYERVELGYLAALGVHGLASGVAGTGATFPMYIGTRGSSIMYFMTNSTARWQITSAGDLYASADNTYDIGASGATRPRNVYVGTSVVAGNSVLVDSVIGHRTGTVLFGGTDGNLRVTNNAGTSFSLMQFGGTTSSFPALKRSSTALQVRLADDTAFAPFAAQVVIPSTTTVASLPTASGVTGALAYVNDATATTPRSTVAGGGSNKVIVFSDGTNWLIVA